MSDIPPYQSIDIVLGKHTCPCPPVPGWYVGSPHGTILITENEDKARAALKPEYTLFRAWIHTHEMIPDITGDLTLNERLHWTPRGNIQSAAGPEE